MNSTYHSESGEWHNAIQRHTANTVSRCCVVQPKFMIWIPIRSDDPWTFGKSSQRGLPLHSAVASSIHESLIRLDCYYPIILYTRKSCTYMMLQTRYCVHCVMLHNYWCYTKLRVLLPGGIHESLTFNLARLFKAFSREVAF
jgi:hypothetical protein